MDDSALPSTTDRPSVQTLSLKSAKSLSPASISTAQKHIIHKKPSHQSIKFNPIKSIFSIHFTDINQQKLETFFVNHPVFFRVSQEFLLFYHPIAFIIFISFFNLGLYFYRSFHLPFYASLTVFALFYYISSLIFSSVWPILYETLFVKDEDIPKYKIPEESVKSPAPKKNNDNKIEQKQQKQDERYDQHNPRRLRTPDEAAKIILDFVEPIQLIFTFLMESFKTQTLEGEEINAAICLFFFFVTYFFDLFWPVVILANVIIIAPSIFCSEHIRDLYHGFCRKWLLSY